MPADTRTIMQKVRELTFETYDARLAAVLGAFLAAFLWWIPVIGPAAAGYVSGRKSGSMTKGFAITLAVGILLVLVVQGLSYLVLGSGGFPGTSAAEASSRLHGVSGAVGSYLSCYFVSGTSALNLSQLGVFAAFGLVGGVLSRQIRKETAMLLSTGAVESAIRPMPRSVELYLRGKQLGFESFDDAIMSQNMSVNNNPDSLSSGGDPPKKREKQAPSTVQTVTTTVTKTSDEDDKGKGPFANILDRSDRRKEGRDK